MMGQQPRGESLFYYFRREEQIPEDHLLRLLDRYVDFRFVRERLQGFYSPTGRPSIDPEVLLAIAASLECRRAVLPGGHGAEPDRHPDRQERGRFFELMQ